ncbi:hypothetical protein BS50DRAFT_644687 [Corynespora cassiicola Philippines]|uniref:Uncharacterized protein n=1 Tax=Corynespora cassiicola Philippines TaxID=1448308 RepID=A0A2T2NHX0_CORCC|nr:hypothetical protein BS50DRAFT_644687 [Corynespora cassiicola Philippines]
MKKRPKSPKKGKRGRRGGRGKHNKPTRTDNDSSDAYTPSSQTQPVHRNKVSVVKSPDIFDDLRITPMDEPDPPKFLSTGKKAAKTLGFVSEVLHTMQMRSSQIHAQIVLYTAHIHRTNDNIAQQSFCTEEARIFYGAKVLEELVLKAMEYCNDLYITEQALRDVGTEERKGKIKRAFRATEDEFLERRGEYNEEHLSILAKLDEHQLHHIIADMARLTESWNG